MPSPPKRSRTSRSFPATRPSASSHETSRKTPSPFPPTRIPGRRIRSGPYIRSGKRLTFEQMYPAVTGLARLPPTEITRPLSTPISRLQESGQSRGQALGTSSTLRLLQSVGAPDRGSRNHESREDQGGGDARLDRGHLAQPENGECRGDHRLERDEDGDARGMGAREGPGVQDVREDGSEDDHGREAQPRDGRHPREIHPRDGERGEDQHGRGSHE